MTDGTGSCSCTYRAADDAFVDWWLLALFTLFLCELGVSCDIYDMNSFTKF